MKENVLNKTKIKVLFTAMITILLIAVIAPCAFANDTANYTISSIENGIRIESVETSETVLVIPDQFEGRDVVEIALNAFANTAVEEITIPATVTKMSGDNRSALCGMEFLTKVTFAEGMRTIPDYALAGCESVTEVVLPESLTTVSAKAFYNCTALKTINLPDSITTIGDEAFSGCSALEEITLPAELTSLGHMAFANCTKISEIALPEYLTTIGTAAFMNTKITEITIPANVTSMYGWYSGRDSWYSYSALDSMENLTKVTFAEGMRTIPENALYLCSYVTEVVLPESLTAVSAKAFNNCTALKTINLPDSITTIGDEAFSGCSALEEITLPAELTALGHMAFANCTKISEIALPEYLTTIGTAAFMNTKIAEITIPANVTSMHGWYSGRDSWYSYSALDSMENLTKVTFAEGMRTIPENALYLCSYVTEVVLPESLTTVSAKAFNNCTALKTINLPDSITTIGDEAFSGCSALEEITLPAELTALGHMAFANCTKISEIALPEYLTTIGTSAFMNTEIAEITIPANVTSMYGWYSGRDSWYSYSALDSMENLTKVTFADGMRVIPENALYNCTYLNEVVVYDCNTSLDAIKEAGNTNGFTVTVLACEECFHTETVYKDAVDATCTTEGYTGDIYCADCDEFISEGEAVAVTEHNFGEWTVVVEATVEAEGQEERACSACDAKETRAIEKLEDNNIIVTEDSTITVDEESMQTSIESDKTVEDIIAQIENQNVIIITPTGEEITADAAVGTGCVIIINNIIQYNIIVHYDVDGNGKVTPADARLALRASAGLDILDGVYETAANYDGKESVSTSDARMILRKAAGLE